jgi:endonuclease/exonuclease/phosphatase family metal-dependent hydrolase
MENNIDFYSPNFKEYVFSKQNIKNYDDKRNYALMNQDEKEIYEKKFSQIINNDITKILTPNKKKYFGEKIKLFKNKLYENEYDRKGEIDHLNDFCKNSKSINDIKPKSKDNSIRVMSFNIHAFIKSCQVYEETNGIFNNNISETNKTSSFEEIIKFINNYNVDILGLQEYAPEFGKKNFLKVTEFYEQYNNISLNTFKDFIISQCKEDLEIDFFGNALFSSINMQKKYIKKYNVIGDQPRCFLGMKINVNNKTDELQENINYETNNNEVYIFNIHPSSEVKGDNNKNQIIDFFTYITKEKDPFKNNILIMGDFNTDKPEIHTLIKNMGYHNIYDLFQINEEYEFTGYHGTIIDYIYVSDEFLNNFTPKYFEIINVDLSDHYPIIFDFIPKTNLTENSMKETIKRYWYNYEKKIINNITKENFLNLILKSNNLYEGILEISKKYGEIINLESGIYLAHGTSEINFDKTNIPFEIQELNNKNLPIVPKSFTILQYPGESFSNFYGTNDPNNFKRLLIYRVNKKIPLLNIYKAENMHKRMAKRLEYYYDLYEYIRINKFQDILDKLNDKIHEPFYAMRFIWLFINKILLNISNNGDNKKLYYGTINSDIIKSDSAFLKTMKNKKKTHELWNYDEVYEGLEIQLFTPELFTEFVGIYYNNKFYSKDEWVNFSENIVEKFKINRDIFLKNNNLEKIPNIRDSNFSVSYAIKYSRAFIVYYINFILTLFNQKDYSNKDTILITENMIKKILDYHDPRYNFPEPFLINLLLNDLFEQISNKIYDINNFTNIPLNKFISIDKIKIISGGYLINYNNETQNNSKSIIENKKDIKEKLTNIDINVLINFKKQLINNIKDFQNIVKNHSNKNLIYILDKIYNFLINNNRSIYNKPPILY